MQRGFPFWLRLLALFTAVPVIEVMIFLELGKYMGTWGIVGLIVVTATLGAKLASVEGLHVFSQIKEELDQGRLPGRKLLEAGFILAGGLLLLTPGFFTDLAGLGMILPVSRRWLGRRLTGYLRARLELGAPWIEQR